MKRSKLCAISSIIGVVVGFILLFGVIGVIAIGYTDGWGLWSKYIEPTDQVAEIVVEENISDASAIVSNKYAIFAANGAISIWNKIPHDYKPGVLGGIICIIGLAFIVCGIACYRKKAKKAVRACAIVDTIILLAMIAVIVLLGIGGCEKVILLSCIGGAALFGILFPFFKICGCVSFAKREKDFAAAKTITFTKVIPENGTSHKSKDRIKLSRKQKKLAKRAKKSNNEIKTLSKPTTITKIKTEQTGINMQGFVVNQSTKDQAKKSKRKKNRN